MPWHFWSNASVGGLVSCNMKRNVGQAYYAYYCLWSPWQLTLLCPFYRGGNWGSGRLSHLPWTAQLRNRGTKTWMVPYNFHPEYIKVRKHPNVERGTHRLLWVQVRKYILKFLNCKLQCKWQMVPEPRGMRLSLPESQKSTRWNNAKHRSLQAPQNWGAVEGSWTLASDRPGFESLFWLTPHKLCGRGHIPSLSLSSLIVEMERLHPGCPRLSSSPHWVRFRVCLH